MVLLPEVKDEMKPGTPAIIAQRLGSTSLEYPRLIRVCYRRFATGALSD